MSKIDLTQLIKILNLTQSDADGEALSAIRMVNMRLKAAGMTWDQLLKVSGKIPGNTNPTRHYRWKEMPDVFDWGFFNSVIGCKEFTSLLDQGQVEWINKVIRFVNANHYIPQEAWNGLRTLWQSFREETST